MSYQIRRKRRLNFAQEESSQYVLTQEYNNVRGKSCFYEKNWANANVGAVTTLLKNPDPVWEAPLDYSAIKEDPRKDPQ